MDWLHCNLVLVLALFSGGWAQLNPIPDLYSILGSNAERLLSSTSGAQPLQSGGPGSLTSGVQPLQSGGPGPVTSGAQPLPSGRPVQNRCSRAEGNSLFNSCLMEFGTISMAQFNFLRTQPVCKAQVFNCRTVDQMIKCINSQPVHVISNTCWSGIKQTLTDYLHRYGVPCTHDDLYRACWRSSEELLPLEKRHLAAGRRRVYTNPMNNLVMSLAMSGNLGHALGM